jgi:hypothetical protein
MIDFWKDNNIGLPAQAVVIRVKTDTITVMKSLMADGFEEVCDAMKIRQRTFFLMSGTQVIIFHHGYQVFETRCFHAA